MNWYLTGIDVQPHDECARSLEQLGERYLVSILSEQERRQAPEPVTPRWIAGRFAAKESIFKTLGASTTDAVSWPQIQVLSTSEGSPEVQLTGTAKDLACRRGLHGLSLSITHTSCLAAACAVAYGAEPSEEDAASAAQDIIHTLHQELTERTTMSDRRKVEDRIRGVLSDQAQLKDAVETVESQDNLYTAGMTSHASVNVMLQLEDAFDIEFPEEKLNRQTFLSISSIADAIQELTND